MGLVRPVGVPSISHSDSSLKETSSVIEVSFFGLGTGVDRTFIVESFGTDWGFTGLVFRVFFKSDGGVSSKIILNVSDRTSQFFVSLNLVRDNAAKNFIF